MTWNPRPIPEITPESEPFWTACADNRLLLSECTDCGLIFYYPRSFCPDCFSDDVSWHEADGTGAIHSYTVARQLANWPKAYRPVVIAYVELDEGPRMLTNIVDCDLDTIEIGDRVEVQFEDVEDQDIAVPVFTPVE